MNPQFDESYRPRPRSKAAQYLRSYSLALAVLSLFALLGLSVFPSTLPSAIDSFARKHSTFSFYAESSADTELGGVGSRYGIEGGAGNWDTELYELLKPDCSRNVVTRLYEGSTTRTGFVSFPRSGNSYMRSLVEATTRYETSSVYCDRGLERTFAGECNHETSFFVKTHFPALPKILAPNSLNYYRQFDQVLHLLRNPLDSIISWWQLSHVGRTNEGYQNHTGKIAPEQNGKYGKAEREELIDVARRWRDHVEYWSVAPVLRRTLRYEDLRRNPVVEMMGVLNFLLPTEQLPPLSEISCITGNPHSHEAYASRRSTDFATYDEWEPSLRLEVLRITRRAWCTFGYDRLLQERIGIVEPDIAELCSGVAFEDEKEEEGEKGA